MSATAYGDEILNGGFEAGTGTDANDWIEIATSPNGTATRSNLDPFAGDFHAYMQFDNSGSAAGANYLVQQVRPVGSIDNTLNYDLRFFARADSTDFTGIQMFVNLQWLDQDASDGGGVKGQHLLSMISNGAELGNTIDTTYKEFTLLNIDVPDGADSFQISFELPAGAVADISNGLYVDNVSLTQAIPEPSAALLLGFGLVGLVARRRRR